MVSSVIWELGSGLRSFGRLLTPEPSLQWSLPCLRDLISYKLGVCWSESFSLCLLSTWITNACYHIGTGCFNFVISADIRKMNEAEHKESRGK